MRIPKTLDNPTRILGIPFDLVAVCGVTYYVLAIFECGMIGFPISIIATHIYSRMRSKSLFRRVRRFVYWYFPAELTGRAGIPGHVRRMKFKSQEKK